MTDLVALAAVIVAAMYAYIAFGVVPRLARSRSDEGRLMATARWGAVVFFAGCAVTHLGTAAEMVYASTRAATGMAGMETSDS